MKILALLGLGLSLALPLCLAEIEIQDTPPAPVTHNPAAPTHTNTTPASTAPTSPPVIATKPTVPPEPIKPGVDADVLKFRNGDQFHGTVLTAAPTSGVRWQRADVKDQITFDLENVGEIALGARLRPGSGPRVSVELTNGDRLEGELVSLDDKTLTLRTWYAGTLPIKHTMLQRLSFLGDSPSAAYSGPNNIDEWKTDGQQRGPWSFRKGALVASGNGTIGRDVKLPDVGSIDMDLAWRGQLAISIAFGCEDVRQIYNSGCYMLQMNYTSIYLQRMHRQGGGGPMGGPLEMQELLRKSKMHLSIRVNKPKKLIALYIDGNLAKQWTEADDWGAHGSGLVFMAQGQGQERISNISVNTWDGRLDTDTGAVAKDSDLVRLSNNDKVSGTVKSVTGGQVSLATSFADMNVPMERIGTIDFASQKSDRARRNPNDIRASFPNGNCVTFALEKLDEKNLTGTSENYGPISAMLGAFNRVQFHIYEKAADTAEEDEWGPATPVNGGQVIDMGDQ